MPPQTPRAKRWLATAALPAALAALCVLLPAGAFARPRPLPWALLGLAAIGAAARWGFSQARRAHQVLEAGLLCARFVGVRQKEVESPPSSIDPTGKAP